MEEPRADLDEQPRRFRRAVDAIVRFDVPNKQFVVESVGFPEKFPPVQ